MRNMQIKGIKEAYRIFYNTLITMAETQSAYGN